MAVASLPSCISGLAESKAITLTGKSINRRNERLAGRESDGKTPSHRRVEPSDLLLPPRLPSTQFRQQSESIMCSAWRVAAAEQVEMVEHMVMREASAVAGNPHPAASGFPISGIKRSETAAEQSTLVISTARGSPVAGGSKMTGLIHGAANVAALINRQAAKRRQLGR